MVDTTTHRRRRRRVPPLAIIVVLLLALMAIIAAVRANGMMRNDDPAGTMPIDTPDEAVMPPNGQAPTGVNPPSATAQQQP